MPPLKVRNCLRAAYQPRIDRINDSDSNEWERERKSNMLLAGRRKIESILDLDQVLSDGNAISLTKNFAAIFDQSDNDPRYYKTISEDLFPTNLLRSRVNSASNLSA